MDCRKAETAMMHHIEKTLKPADARALTAHVLRCDDCRALYFMMDESVEMLAAAPDEAPEGFTERVMTLVHQESVSETVTTKTSAADIALRVLWVAGGILMGVAMLLVLNPQWAAAVALQDGFAWLFTFVGDAFARLTQAEVVSNFMQSGLGITALILAGLIAGLLYGLHRGEKTPPNSVSV